MTARRPSDPAALLARAIALHARGRGHSFGLGEVGARAWASATFEGERVEIDLLGVDPGTAWLSGLPDAELAVGRHFVADLAVRPLGASSVRVEALLLRDG